MLINNLDKVAISYIIQPSLNYFFEFIDEILIRRQLPFEWKLGKNGTEIKPCPRQLAQDSWRAKPAPVVGSDHRWNLL